MADRPSGITISELLLGTAVVGLLLLATAARTLPFSDPVESVLLRLRSHTQLARLEAIRLGRPCRVEVDTSGDRIRVMVDDQVLHEAELPAELTLDAPGGLSGDRGQLVFAPNGRVQSGARQLTFTLADDRGRVLLRENGPASAERWSEGGWVPLR